MFYILFVIFTKRELDKFESFLQESEVSQDLLDYQAYKGQEVHRGCVVKLV